MQGEHEQWFVILFVYHVLLSRLDHGRAGLVRYDKHFCDLEAHGIKLPTGYTLLTRYHQSTDSFSAV